LFLDENLFPKLFREFWINNSNTILFKYLEKFLEYCVDRVDYFWLYSLIIFNNSGPDACPETCILCTGRRLK